MFWKTAFKKFEVILSAYADNITSKFLKVFLQKFFLVHSWISKNSNLKT